MQFGLDRAARDRHAGGAGDDEAVEIDPTLGQDLEPFASAGAARIGHELGDHEVARSGAIVSRAAVIVALAFDDDDAGVVGRARRSEQPVGANSVAAPQKGITSSLIAPSGDLTVEPD
jgi:hypothetical protein